MNSIAASSTSATSAGDVIVAVMFIISAVVIYWTPTIVAAARHVPNRGSVAVINGLLGWTVVGWAVALAMAVRSVPPAYGPGFYQPPGQAATGPGWQPPGPLKGQS